MVFSPISVAVAIVLGDFSLDLRRCLFVFSLAGYSFAFPDAIGLQLALATPPSEQQGRHRPDRDLCSLCGSGEGRGRGVWQR